MIKNIIAQLLDESIVLSFAALGTIVLDLVLRVFGYTIATWLPILFIMFGIFNVLYFPLMIGSKYKTTVGKRILKLDDAKEEVIG